MKSSDHKDDINYEFKTTIDFAACLSTPVFGLQVKGFFTCQISKGDPPEPNIYFFIQCFIEVCQWYTKILNFLS